MECEHIRETTAVGREVARATLAATGKEHQGKGSIGRPAKANAVKAWRKEKSGSIRETAEHCELSDSTTKQYCATA